MQRWPVIIALGAALIGWVAGELIVAGPGVAARIEAAASWLRWVVPAVAALAVVALGKAFTRAPLARSSPVR